ncbi:MAG: sigma-70 family RNA polymerase sigma factor [Actinomycetia bacterium]|nr:sigma-70 family RNA polymerase sigma factor [Actinomycetes bacterium]
MRRRSVLATTDGPAEAATQRAAEIETFMEHHAQRIVGALTLITGDRNAAEDALQDALVKAWQRHDQPIEQLSAWITVVATNNVRSGWRRSNAEARALGKVGGRAAPEQPSSREPDEALHAALRSLPERERQVAIMHYVLDESVASIADALGVADGTVKTLLHRARHHLAVELRLNDEGADL